MRVSIVALGESAKNWYDVPCETSIGVNDAWKWGNPTDYLVILNRIAKFPKERYETIINSNPVKLYTHIPAWAELFEGSTLIKLRQWDGHLYENTYAHAQTSPLVAMDLARKIGATEIILWGVDFNTHHIFNNSNPYLGQEVRVYRQMIEALGHINIKVYSGCEGGALNLPVWKTSQS